ncbi:hypothetical protein L3Q65_45890 [Amycolatopsis sp. FU40]|uniref:hypothetical protein n=1 Tax=Amycolatopsis sp. FU40 TaxID=2914159 RepID=UPI001F38B555|nr:hypothetical protein [Amycolatopsis sp. FU40]UKD55107.1 hypothetical protein L3Q65_45890 [Amycolatopsis sp. FU40]
MSEAAVEYKENGVVVLSAHPAFPEPHNRLDHGVCGCGKEVGDIAGWEEHRREIGREKLRSRLRPTDEPTREQKLARELRERNRLYGKASATIGELRAVVARLTLERAQERQAVPGFVDGDLLADVLTDNAPAEWARPTARAHAEKTLAAIAAAGFRVLRGPGREPWPPEPEPEFERFHADKPVQSPPRRWWSHTPCRGMKVRRLADRVIRTVTSARPDPTAQYGVAVFVDEGRVTATGPISLDEWEPWSPGPKPGGAV